MMNLVAAAALASVRREPAPLAKLAVAKLAAADSGRRMVKLVAAAAPVRREAAPVAKLAVTSPVAKRVAGMLAVAKLVVAKLAVTSAVAKRAAAIQIASLNTSMHCKKPHGAPWPSTPVVQLCAW